MVILAAPIHPTTLQVGFLPTNSTQQVHLASNLVHHLLRWAVKESRSQPVLILEMFDYFPITVTQTFFTYLLC